MNQPQDTAKPTRDNSSIQVIARAAHLLRCLGGDTLSLAVLARRTGLPRSTVQRIVDALVAERLLEAGEGGVRLGWGLKELGDCVADSVVSQLREPLEALFQQTRETVDLSVLEGAQMRFVQRFVSDQEVRVVPMLDRPFAAHAMANGKAILACQAPQEVERLLPASLQALTAHTLTSRSALARELQQVRATGIASDREEHAPGVCAIATSISVPGLRPYAISVVVPAFRFDAVLPAISEALLACREQCLQRLASPGSA
ncbi:IclR family transcriptional regulator [Pseudomonas sp. HR96]|uniref:IclR family transcriptional regulator n=1 Tax=Pseudomonas sp. HR96 TaxID=1027966 RepID=UPI002A75E853|nr:IclR family transcriptional regulator [Pseudomonas sp. HR96]WPO97655.1 IclR family transcriptional regulator [Pseudomonas sp. HR96]